jgi:glycerophosphoryl diester phosphodiesterase
MIVSFLATALDEVKQRLPGVRTVFHLGPAPEPARGTPYWGVGIQEPAEGSVIRGAQELGLATLVFTVNEPDRMQELAALGVDGIFSDRPALLAKTLAAVPRG